VIGHKSAVFIVSEKTPPCHYFLYNPAKKIKQILIIFDTQNPEDICRWLFCSFPLHLKKCHHTTLRIAELLHLVEVIRLFRAKIRQSEKKSAGCCVARET